MNETTHLPPTLGIKLCAHCHNQFSDGGFAAKVYCSIRCRDGAKRRRAVSRSAPKVVASVHSAPSENPELINATIEQLNAHAEKLNSGMLKAFVVLKGIVPKWRSPYPNVKIQPQFNSDPILTHVDMIVGANESDNEAKLAWEKLHGVTEPL